MERNHTSVSPKTLRTFFYKDWEFQSFVFKPEQSSLGLLGLAFVNTFRKVWSNFKVKLPVRLNSKIKLPIRLNVKIKHPIRPGHLLIWQE